MRTNKGQGSVEFIVAMPVLLLLLLGALQMAFVFQAKTTLTYATAKAVRSAALQNGSIDAFRAGMERGLAPLFPEVTNAAGVASAQLRADAVVLNPLDLKTSLLNPTVSVLQTWGAQTVYSAGVLQQEIPNSRLIFATGGTQAGETLQAANLLKVQVEYCEPLIVPFINQAIALALKFAPMSLWEQACVARQGLPLQSTGTELMQSPFLVTNAKGYG